MNYYSDFETTTTLINNEVVVYLWGIISEDDSVRLWDVSLDSFYDFLSSLKGNNYIYFHNLSWDGVFLIHYLIDRGYKFYNKTDPSGIPKGYFSWVCDENTNIYKIYLTIEKNNKIVFLDSYKILLTSIKDLGKILGLEKKEINYDEFLTFKSKDEVPAHLVEYLMRDIEVAKNSMILFSNTTSKVKTTLASTMLGEFRSYYGAKNFDKDFKYKLKFEEWDIVRESYAGGFTAQSPLYKEKIIEIDGLGYSYDVNSLYPSVMINNKMPYGAMMFHPPTQGSYIKLYKIYIYKGVNKTNNFPDCLRVGVSFIFTKYSDFVECEEVYYWETEWEMLKKIYHFEYDIMKTYYFKTKYVFKDFLNGVKDQKINAKNNVERFIAKIKQNSLYGKFGENRVRKSKILVFDDEYKLEGKRYGKDGFWVESLTTNEVQTLSYIPIASYITALSRVILFEAIYNNVDNFLYCDTDSIYLKDKAKGIEIDAKEYGKWKMEHKITKFKSLKPKCYMFQDENGSVYKKIAGLPNANEINIPFDEFIRGNVIHKGKLQKTHQKGGLILQNTDYTL